MLLNYINEITIYIMEDPPNIVLKYITLCQLCSSLWTSHRLIKWPTCCYACWLGNVLIVLKFNLHFVGFD